MKTPKKDLEESPIRGLRALADIEPPPSLAPAVMRAIAQPQTGLGPWLRKLWGIELRLTPLTAGALGLLLVGGGFVVGTNRGAGPRPIPLDVTGASLGPSADLVHVRFVLVAKGAKKVAVAGDFNGWNADAVALEDSRGDGVFVATVALPRGAHEYMFVVDGDWITDPAAAERRPDGFGRDNAVLRL